MEKKDDKQNEAPAPKPVPGVTSQSIPRPRRGDKYETSDLRPGTPRRGYETR